MHGLLSQLGASILALASMSCMLQASYLAFWKLSFFMYKMKIIRSTHSILELVKEKCVAQCFIQSELSTYGVCYSFNVVL